MAKRIIKISAKDIVKKSGLKDGYTPIKGKDYFDGTPGKSGISIKGDPGQDGRPGISVSLG